MPDRQGIERIAAAMHQVRPDWRADSLVTFLAKHHAHRPYRDLAIAAIAVATDERTRTPQLLNEHGAWWVAAQAGTSSTAELRFKRCEQIGHTSFPAHNCSACRSEALEATEQERVLTQQGIPRDRVRQIIREATSD